LLKQKLPKILNRSIKNSLKAYALDGLMVWLHATKLLSGTLSRSGTDYVNKTNDCLTKHSSMRMNMLITLLKNTAPTAGKARYRHYATVSPWHVAFVHM